MAPSDYKPSDGERAAAVIEALDFPKLELWTFVCSLQDARQRSLAEAVLRNQVGIAPWASVSDNEYASLLEALRQWMADAAYETEFVKPEVLPKDLGFDSIDALECFLDVLLSFEPELSVEDEPGMGAELPSPWFAEFQLGQQNWKAGATADGHLESATTGGRHEVRLPSSKGRKPAELVVNWVRLDSGKGLRDVFSFQIINASAGAAVRIRIDYPDGANEREFDMRVPGDAGTTAHSVDIPVEKGDVAAPHVRVAYVPRRS
jgi:hypothetical protein